MGSATELHGNPGHLHHPHLLLPPVLLLKVRDGPFLFCFLQRKLLHVKGNVPQDRGERELFHFGNFRGSEGGKVGEVEAQFLRPHPGTGLDHVLAQNFSKSSMEKVGSRVRPLDFPAPLLVHPKEAAVPLPEFAGDDPHLV
jgi:hypothetical protein